METINFGIDLGTTNSLIAKFENGKVQVFKNPVGFKETLPSCVAFRGERILVGDKAREYITKDPLNVFSAFKRKMGTSEKYFVPTLMESFSPSNFSALVLKELKNFIPATDNPRSIVITIPASFDTVQCNVTKEAGIEAGFEEVVLLQEPIAASLAFFNDKMSDADSLGKWLVYDLGGGTFDIALITIDQDEMRVIDHEGDNFLGGVDLDQLILNELILPKLKEITGKDDLDRLINQRNGPYEKLYYILLLKAEEAKKELSIKPDVDIEFTFEMEGENPIDVYFVINRKDFESLIESKIDYTIEFIQKIFQRNQIQNQDIKNIILIGGSTLIPFIRQKLKDSTGIEINYSADPSTAVAIGAAYYAGAKLSRVSKSETEASNTLNTSSIQIQLAYNKTTKDKEEYITAVLENIPENYTYRIVRNDGGYDSGIKKATAKIGEFVLLKPNAVNFFTIKIYDEKANEIAVNAQTIEITHGLFSLYGQTLPEDICIEVDDLNNNTTLSEVIFARNSILPLKKTIYKELSRTIKKGTEDNLIINILEGNQAIHPSANKVIGVVEINGNMIESDLVIGSDVEITLEISESREISVKALLSFTNQTFNHLFNPKEKYISLLKLKEELHTLQSEMNVSLDKILKTDDFEKAAKINDLLDVCKKLTKDISKLRDNDIDENKYQLEEQKRRLATAYYSIGVNNSPVYDKKEKLQSIKNYLDSIITIYNDIPTNLQEEYQEMVKNYPETIKSDNHFQLNTLYMKMNKFYTKLIYATPSLLVNLFYNISGLPPQSFKDYNRVQKLIERGEAAIAKNSHNELLAISNDMWSQLIDDETVVEKIKGTGLGS